MHISGRWCDPAGPGFGLEPEVRQVHAESRSGLTVAQDVETVAAKLVGTVSRPGPQRRLHCALTAGAGRPLTFEHEGILSAASNALAATGDIRAADVEAQLRANQGSAAPIGRVVAADRHGR